jgi:hypothetical protein
VASRAVPRSRQWRPRTHPYGTCFWRFCFARSARSVPDSPRNARKLVTPTAISS